MYSKSIKMERPLDQFRTLFKKSNEQNRELLKYVFEKSDSMSLWIIGLAIGGIAIFANNIGGIKSTINVCFLKPILYLLATSVTCGIIYRSLYLYFFVILNQTYNAIDVSFTKEKIMDTESYLKGDENFQELIKVVYDGFEEDLSHLIPEYENQTDTDKKKTLYDGVVEHYLRSVEWAKKDTENAMEFAADTYSKFFDVSKKAYNKMLSGDSGSKQYKVVLWTTSVFYLAYLLAFIASLFLFVQGV